MRTGSDYFTQRGVQPTANRRTWSRQPLRVHRPEDQEELRRVAEAWRRGPTGLLSGRNVDRVRAEARGSWGKPYSWLESDRDLFAALRRVTT